MSKDQQETKIKTFEQNKISFLINEERSTVDILDSEPSQIDLIIPRSVTYNSKKYNIINILENAFQETRQVKSIQFSEDSEIQAIEKNAFLHSSIESLTIPSSLVELKEGWCNGASNLKKIDISPNNKRYKLYENKFIIGKSSIESENFDVLIFCIRNIEETVIVPSFIKIIGSYSFQHCKQLKKIEVQNDSQLQIIEKYAFMGSSIESLSIPSNLIELKEGWCCDTQKLTKIFVSSDNPLFKIHDDKFLIGKSSIESDNFDVLVFCDRNAETATIPRFIKCIGSYAFDDCKQIQTIEIPTDSELQTVGKYAFLSTEIECFTIPSKLVELKKGWCQCTLNLTKINISTDNKSYKVYEDKLLIGKSSVESENFDVLVMCLRDAKTVTIPSFIKKIEPYAFNNCNQIHTIEIPSDSELQIIEKYAFSYSSIASIDIPKYVSKIDKFAFFQCKNLQKVEIAKDSELKNIEKYCFFESAIESFTIPSSVKKIKRFAFYNCRSLQNVEIPINSELISIKKCSFAFSSIESIKIPHHVSRIGEFAFSQCIELKKVEIPTDSELQIIERGAFEQTSIESIIIPSRVEFIGEYSFDQCDQLKTVDIATDSQIQSIERGTFQYTSIERISIPPKVKHIKENAFLKCLNLRSVEFASDSELQIIEDAAFSLSSIESISIPFHVKIIKNFVFAGCKNIQSVEIPIDSELQKIGKNVFVGSAIESFTISSNLINLNEDWCFNTPKLTKIKVSPKNQLYSLYDDKLIIGKSSIESAIFDSIIFCVRDAKTVTIPSFIKDINSNAFRDCQLLETIEIPTDSQLQAINNFSFINTSIKCINIPQYVTIIGEKAFFNCSKLQKVEFSTDSKLQIIEKNSFYKSSIERISIPKSVTKIGEGSFCNCSKLQQIEIPIDSDLQTIEKRSFYGSSIESLTIPSKLSELKEGWCMYTPKLNKISVSPNNPFYKAYDGNLIIGKTSNKSEDFDYLVFCVRNVNKVTIPSFIKKIGSYALNECKNLGIIEIPTNSELQIIEACSFSNTSIESITIPSKLIKLAKNWCFRTHNLNKFYIHPENKHYINFDNNYIVGKINDKSQDFDVITFARRNIDIAIIPSNIKIIGDFAFNGCHKLIKIEFQPISQIKIIDEHSFFDSSIKTIKFPSSLICIKNAAFSRCTKLKKVEFPIDSKLQVIEKEAFMYSLIESISFPPELTQIGEKAFSNCTHLQIVEINENSKLREINPNIFDSNYSIMFMVPSTIKI